MKKPSVAIIKSDFHEKHSTSWSNVWINYCVENNISHVLIDWRGLNSFDKLTAHDIILWHYSHYSRDEMCFARNILQSLKAKGCYVYPDIGDSDHFDDKVAQAYLFKGLGLPTPKNYPMHSLNAVEEWITSVGLFPIVAKLRTGSGSSNVRLINNTKELQVYAKNMFERGFESKPSTLFKIKSNWKSTKSLGQFMSRLMRVPDFIFSRKMASGREREIGYVYLQEFVPGVNYDLKVVVVGDRLSFVARSVREGDFRASGGGSLFFDKSLVTKQIINVAFQASDALNSDCTGFDMITDPRTGLPVILEVSYGFSHLAQLDARGYFDREGNWFDQALNPPQQLLVNILNKVCKN